jgi:serine/threonine-protein kinase
VSRDAGKLLGRYCVVDEIGVGGMASVHLARVDGPGGFQKWVAIKRIHDHLVEDEAFVNMFFDEARVAASISHPNVATVFDLGKDGDSYWIAMEYLHGEPLREAMRRTESAARPAGDRPQHESAARPGGVRPQHEASGQPMPPEIACRIIADAAEGLHAAHELLGPGGEKLDLVHRDVTPHNLFVTYEGVTKVVDFGIAKFSSRAASTRTGILKGKIAYMSPEQIAGEPIDRRTDVFALGVVLWELTTGQRLFRMESDLDTMAKVKECAPPRPSAIVRGYPIDLEKLVLKALSKNKNERYRTAREFSRALQSLLMRRGLFVGTDEVAAYMHSLFADRIRKREEHLRRAADVTQDTSEQGEAIARAMSRSELASVAVRAQAFDDVADTVISPLPDMSEFGATTAPAPHPAPSESSTVPPRGRLVLPGTDATGSATVTVQAAPRRVPTWVALAGAILLGALAFVLVLFTLSRLSAAPRRAVPSIVGEYKP